MRCPCCGATREEFLFARRIADRNVRANRERGMPWRRLRKYVAFAERIEAHRIEAEIAHLNATIAARRSA